MRVALVLAVLLFAPLVQDRAARPPDARTQKKLVDEVLVLDLHDSETHARRDEILARLELVPALKAKDVKTWRKRIDKALSKRPTIETKSGWGLLWPEEPLKRSFRVGGQLKKPKGVFIGLHGGRKNEASNDGCYYIYAEAAQMNEWVALFPIRVKDIGRRWSDAPNEEFVAELIERALRTWDVDPNHVYIAGHSGGGLGSWWMATHRPDSFAGVGPSAGIPPSATQNVVLNLRNVRTVVYHGAQDPIVTVEPDRRAAAAVEEARATYGGFDFEYWEEAESGHEAPPGGGVRHLGKLRDGVRDPRPARIVWAPLDDAKRRMYWLRWDAPRPGTVVVADADRETNTIAIETSAARGGFALLLDDALVDLEQPVRIEFNGELAFEGLVEARLATLVATALEGDASYVFAHEVRLPD